jgi:hypothetical protein
MAKLPAEFVKSTQTAAKKPRTGGKRRKKATLLEEEARRAADLHREVLLRLTEEEHSALEAACAELGEAGERLTVEQMIHRAIGDWIARRKPATTTASAPPEAAAGIVASLVRFARSRLQGWRDLGAAIRRFSAARP